MHDERASVGKKNYKRVEITDGLYSYQDEKERSRTKSKNVVKIVDANFNIHPVQNDDVADLAYDEKVGSLLSKKDSSDQL